MHRVRTGLEVLLREAGIPGRSLCRQSVGKVRLAKHGATLVPGVCAQLADTPARRMEGTNLNATRK